MFILYIDGSGSVANPNEAHFILAGVAVFERQIFHMIKELDDLVESFGLGPAEEIELHGSPMYGGKGNTWRPIPRGQRVDMMQQALSVLTTASESVRAFGISVHKQARLPDNPVEYAFEEMCNRFNHYLSRRFQSRGGREEDKQKGLVVMDESHYEEPLQALARDFRIRGTRWGHLRNMGEVPLFVDSRASRLIQLADLVAFAMWRQYEYQDGRFFGSIISRFDRDKGVLHGLVHYKPRGAECFCPACMSRQIRQSREREDGSEERGQDE